MAWKTVCVLVLAVAGAAAAGTWLSMPDPAGDAAGTAPLRVAAAAPAAGTLDPVPHPESSCAPAQPGGPAVAEPPAVVRGSSGPGVARLRGVVRDPSGNPVAGMSVFAGGQPGPFLDSTTHAIAVRERRIATRVEGGVEYWSEREPERLADVRIYIGRTVATDTHGRFELTIAEPATLFVAPLPVPGLRPQEPRHRWVEAPGEVAFVVERIPTATLRVSVTDRADDRRLETIRGSVTLAGEDHALDASRDGFLTRTLELDAGSLDAVIEITEPAWARTRRDVVLAPGDLEIEVDGDLGFDGLVLDPRGLPVRDALVFCLLG